MGSQSCKNWQEVFKQMALNSISYITDAITQVIFSVYNFYFYYRIYSMWESKRKVLEETVIFYLPNIHIENWRMKLWSHQKKKKNLNSVWILNPKKRDGWEAMALGTATHIWHWYWKSGRIFTKCKPDFKVSEHNIK